MEPLCGSSVRNGVIYYKSERPVYERETGGELIRKICEPRIVHRDIDEAELNPVEIFRVVYKAQLEAGIFLRDVDPAGLQANEGTLRNVEKAALPASELVLVDVDDAPSDAGIGIGIVHETQGKAAAVTGAAIHKSQGEGVLRVFTPDAQGEAVNFGGFGIDGKVRGERGLKEFLRVQAGGTGNDG